MEKPVPNSAVPENDRLFGDLVVEQGITTREKVDECLSAIGRLIAAGVTPVPSLGELLVQKGYLSSGHYEATMRLSERTPRSDVQAHRVPEEPEVPPEVGRAAGDPANLMGKYVRVSLLGAGGMGEVWKGWDRNLGRWVALKFLKGDDPDELARFKREAQTAAKLNHPNIGAVHEVGDDQGKPFIAMQFVEGQTLHTFPRDNTGLLVELIRDAALALHHAHEQGVIHRDLKPHNIMVEGEPGPRVKTTRRVPGTSRRSRLRVYVMDFGLAKSTSLKTEQSVSGLILGTPAYMSPEQARADRSIDSRTDVYSLGATLYELLTDRRPFQDSNVYDLLRKVVEQDPRPARKLAPKVNPDLETIVAKCLEKDRARRYETALELAEDLSRYLEGEAILAHPPSLAYRLQRWMGRRKALTAALAVVVLTAAAGGTALVVQQGESSRREDALRELAALRAAIVEQKRDLRQLKIPADRAHTALRQSIAAVEDHIQRWPGEPQGYYVAARGWLYLGDLDRAEQTIRAALTQHPEFRPGWALLGMVKTEQAAERFIGTKESLHERARDAQPLLEEGLRAFARGWEKGREREESKRWGLAWTAEDAVLGRLGRAFQLYYGEKNQAGARRVLEEGLREYRAEEYLLYLSAWSHDEEVIKHHLAAAVETAPGYANAYFFRGNLKVDQGDHAGAVADYDRALKLRKDLPRVYVNRATAKMELGDSEGAIADLDRCIELSGNSSEAYFNRGSFKRRSGDHVDAIRDLDQAIHLRKDFPKAYFARGSAKMSLGDLEDAVADYDRAIELNEEFADAYDGRGIAKKKQGDWEGAIKDFDRAIGLNENFPSAYFSRGEARSKTGDLAGALSDYDRALALKEDFPEAYANRGVMRGKQGDFEGAIADFNRALELDTDNGLTYYNRGNVWKDQGDSTRAIADYDRAIELKADFAEAYHNRGVAKEASNDVAGALQDLNRALELKEDFAEAYLNRSNAKMKQGDLAGALADCNRALKVKPRFPEAYMNRGEVKRARGDVGGAIADYDRAIELRDDYSEAYNNRGIAREAQGDRSGAFADFNRAIELRGDFADAFNNRGTLKMKQRDAAGAILDYTRAIELRKNYARAYSNRGGARAARGELPGAIADFNRAIELSPRNPMAHFNRALLKQMRGDLGGAVGDWTKAIEFQPNYVDAYARRGLARELLAKREPALALQHLRGAESDLVTAIRSAPQKWRFRDAARGGLTRVRQSLGSLEKRP